MSRWKYKTAPVTVGENTLRVRQLTAGEQRQFVEANRKNLAAQLGDAKADLSVLVVKFGAVEPALTDEDAAAMPPDFMEACVAKILELSDLRQTSGNKTEGTGDAVPVEKKDETSTGLNS